MLAENWGAMYLICYHCSICKYSCGHPEIGPIVNASASQTDITFQVEKSNEEKIANQGKIYTQKKKDNTLWKI